jgi:uncharacterized membrane protein YphA (DoxX/SURF4 family)
MAYAGAMKALTTSIATSTPFGLTLLVYALAPAPALAHAKWFLSTEAPPVAASALSQPILWITLGLVALVVAAAWWLQRLRGGQGFLPSLAWFGALPERRSALYGVIPAVLAVHLAVPLFVRGVQGQLFSPDLHIPGALAYLVGLVQVGVALAFFYGGLTRLAALALAGLWLAGFALSGIEGMFDNALMLGFAGFFWLAGRGPLAIDRLIFPRFEPTERQMSLAVQWLRIGLGVGLVSAALTEKLANLPLAGAFLAQHQLNFLPALGIPISNEVFAALAGSVELLVGLCLIFNVFVREIIIIAWFPLNLTLTVFNWSELIGHLPIYGVMALLLVWEQGTENQDLWLKGLREGPIRLVGP